MECNKDEAVRAKEIAENKMKNNDFEGAQKLALKAKRLFPELENISQILAVCDVHCSAQRKVYGGEKDLYGILQVESFADEATIKKQYRKLALVLHPDKNKFPGAEAAFKLIGEANMILSDRGKRSLHDIKCREPTRSTAPKPQTHQRNQNPSNGMQFGAQFSGTNHHQQSQIRSFWTQCPFCFIKHHYYMDMVNRAFKCKNCSKLFIAYDIGVQRDPPAPHSAHTGTQNLNQGSNRGRATFFQQQETGRQGNVNVDTQMAGRFSSHFAYQTCSSTGVESSRGTRMEENGNKDTGVAKKPKESKNSKATNKKKGRKTAVEASDSGLNEDSFVGTRVESNKSRKRSKISNSEKTGDGSTPAKRSKPTRLSSDVEDTAKDNNVSNPAEDVKKDVPEQNGHSKSNSDSEDDPEPVYIICPDLDFSNFDKDKEEHCFAADQIWACYDTIDGMPRFYAQIRKVYSNGFRLRITWLEADPENHLEIIWAEEGLPVSCGKYVSGDTEETQDRLMFSHQIAFEKGKSTSKTKFSFVIYPKKGEIWALYRDWDINWSSDPENHTKFKFDIVEILSDFDNDNGVLVAYMVKVEGFVSLFQKTSRARLAEHKVPASELFRFSHRIPSVKLSGTERADVPVGSCELDTASLPDDLNEYYFSSKAKVNSESAPAQTSASSPQSPEPKAKSEAKNESDKEMLNLRRSPRGLKGNFDQSNGVEDNINNPSKIPNHSCKEPKIVHDFIADKKNRKFQEGEIWAIRRNNDGIGNPRCYAQIKKIESSPIRLHVDLLELCPATGLNACGLFKASNGSRQILTPDSFSYLVNAERNGRNIFNIYPKEKEIWALYSKQDSESLFSNRDLSECDVVEVLENDGRIVKVLLLSRVPGYKSVFKAGDVQKSKVSILRFAYRMPAFLLTDEQDGQLRGCWELDLAEVPGPAPSQA